MTARTAANGCNSNSVLSLCFCPSWPWSSAWSSCCVTCSTFWKPTRSTGNTSCASSPLCWFTTRMLSPAWEVTWERPPFTCCIGLVLHTVIPLLFRPFWWECWNALILVFCSSRWIVPKSIIRCCLRACHACFVSISSTELLSRLLTSAFEGYDLENMITAFLLARQGALEGPGIFPSYSDWFKVVYQFIVMFGLGLYFCSVLWSAAILMFCCLSCSLTNNVNLH